MAMAVNKLLEVQENENDRESEVSRKAKRLVQLAESNVELNFDDTDNIAQKIREKFNGMALKSVFRKKKDFYEGGSGESGKQGGSGEGGGDSGAGNGEKGSDGQGGASGGFGRKKRRKKKKIALDFGED